MSILLAGWEIRIMWSLSLRGEEGMGLVLVLGEQDWAAGVSWRPWMLFIFGRSPDGPLPGSFLFSKWFWEYPRGEPVTGKEGRVREKERLEVQPEAGAEGRSQEPLLDLEPMNWPWREGLCQQYGGMFQFLFLRLFPAALTNTKLRLV